MAIGQIRGRSWKMDEIMNKFGAYWFNQKANKEISSVGDDINVRFPDFSLFSSSSFDMNYYEKVQSSTNLWFLPYTRM